MVDDLHARTEMTLDYIKTAHALLCCQAIESVPGKFKISRNMIVGADFETTPPYLVTTELENWRRNLFCQLQAAKTNDAIVESICRQHIAFERIHPFPDGNGRVGRALLVYSCLQSGILPIVIPVQEKKKYIHFLNTENLNSLVQFAIGLQTLEIARIEAFACKKENAFWNLKQIL